MSQIFFFCKRLDCIPTIFIVPVSEINKSFLCSVCVGSAKVSQVKTSSNAPKALIIEPSKELAEQTLNNVKQFKKYVDNPKLRYEAAPTWPDIQ